MDKKFYYAELFEIYKKLLTDKQREIFEMHIVFDLSLSEISEEKGITRQNVSDTVKNTKEKLSSLERALKLKAKNDMLLALCGQTDGETSTKIKEIIEY